MGSQARRRAPAHRGLAVALSVFALGALGWSISGAIQPAIAAPGARDRAPARAFLEAGYLYDSAFLADIGTGEEAVRQLATRLEAECGGVLAGAPPAQAGTASGATPLQRMQSEQISELSAELEFDTLETALLPAHPAVTTYTHAVTRLHWHDAHTRRLVASLAQKLNRELAAPLLEVCPDLRAWVASGYRTLSPTTTAFASRIAPTSENSVSQQALESTFAHRYGGALRALQSARRACARVPPASCSRRWGWSNTRAPWSGCIRWEKRARRSGAHRSRAAPAARERDGGTALGRVSAPTQAPVKHPPARARSQ